MTVTIEDKTYEADSAEEITKLLRKHQREAAKREKEDNRKREQAQLMAKEKACILYERIIGKLDCPRAWIAYEVHSDYGTALCRNHPNPWTKILSVEDKDVVVEMWGQYITHVVCNGSGYVWALFTRDNKGIDTRFYTIAQFEGVWSLHECPTVKLEWFRDPKRGE